MDVDVIDKIKLDPLSSILFWEFLILIGAAILTFLFGYKVETSGLLLLIVFSMTSQVVMSTTLYKTCRIAIIPIQSYIYNLLIMASTSPPYHNSTFGAPDQDINSTTPTGTYLNQTGTTHPETTHTPNPDTTINSQPHNPHRSSLLNKLDPRVDTSNMSGTTSSQTTGVTYTDPRSTESMAGGQTHGSSTGAAGSAPGLRDSRSQYDPRTTGYNPATGSGYSTVAGGYQDTQDNRAEHATSTTNKNPASGTFGSMEGSPAGRKGEELGQGVRSTAAGIHVRFFYVLVTTWIC